MNSGILGDLRQVRVRFVGDAGRQRPRLARQPHDGVDVRRGPRLRDAQHQRVRPEVRHGVIQREHRRRGQGDRQALLDFQQVLAVDRRVVGRPARRDIGVGDLPPLDLRRQRLRPVELLVNDPPHHVRLLPDLVQHVTHRHFSLSRPRPHRVQQSRRRRPALQNHAQRHVRLGRPVKIRAARSRPAPAAPPAPETAPSAPGCAGNNKPRCRPSPPHAPAPRCAGPAPRRSAPPAPGAP